MSLYKDISVLIQTNSDIAIKIHHGKSLTYNDLNNISNKFTNFFQKHIKDFSQCVGLLTYHNLFLPSCIISFLRHNLTFTFLDPDAEVSKNLQRIDRLQLPWLLIFDSNVSQSSLISGFSFCAKLTIEDDCTVSLWKSTRHSKFWSTLQDICYVICTSGTTGTPKTVRVTHDSIYLNVIALKQIFSVDKNDVIYFGTNLTFDPCMIELFLSLLSGSTLLITSKKIHINPSKLLRSISEVTVLQMCPSLFLRWNKEEINQILNNRTLRILALGGEKFPNSILELKRSENLRIFNLYGITEISCWASIKEVRFEDSDVDLGQGLPETILEVRDENGVVREGEGELFIGSEKRVCLLDDELKMEGTVFRGTGDLVTVNKNGLINYLGRMKNSFKRNGIKIDFLEIEKLVFELTGLENKCFGMDMREVAKVILIFKIDDINFNIKEKIIDKLRLQLLHNLPKEYFPDFIDIFRNFPVTSHGKLDENFIFNVVNQTQTLLSPLEIFDDLLQKYFGLHDFKDYTFFDLGGNSILLVQFLEHFRLQLGEDNPIDLINVLLEKSVQDCRQYLVDYYSKNPQNKRQLNSNNNKTQKRFKPEITNNLDLKFSKTQIKWKYDLKACVDCPANVLKKRNEIIVAAGSFSHIFATLDGCNGKEISKVVLPDVIQSSCLFSPDENCAFIGCFDGCLYCVELQTGNILRKYQTGGQIKSTPRFCSNLEKLVLGAYDKYVHCIITEDFKVSWKTHLKESVSANIEIFNNLLLIATVNGSCFCLSEEKGDIIWKHSATSPILNSSALLRSEESICWPTASGKIISLNCNNGKEIWTFQASDSMCSALIAHKDIITFGSFDCHLYCLDYTKTFCGLRWKVYLKKPVYCTPSVWKSDEDFLVTANVIGNIFIVKITDGEIVRWFSLNSECFSSPRVVDNFLIIGCRDNNLYCIDMDENK